MRKPDDVMKPLNKNIQSDNNQAGDRQVDKQARSMRQHRIVMRSEGSLTSLDYSISPAILPTNLPKAQRIQDVEEDRFHFGTARYRRTVFMSNPHKLLHAQHTTKTRHKGKQTPLTIAKEQLLRSISKKETTKNDNFLKLQVNRNITRQQITSTKII